MELTKRELGTRDLNLYSDSNEESSSLPMNPLNIILTQISKENFTNDNLIKMNNPNNNKIETKMPDTQTQSDILEILAFLSQEEKGVLLKHLLKDDSDFLESSLRPLSSYHSYIEHLDEVEDFNFHDHNNYYLLIKEVNIIKSYPEEKIGLTFISKKKNSRETLIFISQIEQNALAYLDNQLQEGDQLIKINGIPINSLQIVAELLKKDALAFKFEIARPKLKKALNHRRFQNFDLGDLRDKSMNATLDSQKEKDSGLDFKICSDDSLSSAHAGVNSDYYDLPLEQTFNGLRLKTYIDDNDTKHKANNLPDPKYILTSNYDLTSMGEMENIYEDPNDMNSTPFINNINKKINKISFIDDPNYESIIDANNLANIIKTDQDFIDRNISMPFNEFSVTHDIQNLIEKLIGNNQIQQIKPDNDDQYPDVMYTNSQNLMHTITLQQRLVQEVLKKNYHLHPRKNPQDHKTGNSQNHPEISNKECRMKFKIKRRSNGTRYMVREEDTSEKERKNNKVPHKSPHKNNIKIGEGSSNKKTKNNSTKHSNMAKISKSVFKNNSQNQILSVITV
ncbi:uncharacterized protein MAL13P1.336-like isoform X2 [Gordionus sp. m RMFG-2023]